MEPKVVKELEYASALLRFYIGNQFAQLSIYATLTGAELVLIFVKPGLASEHIPLAAAIALFVATVFWVTWESQAYIVGHLLKRMAVLEQEVEFCSISSLPGMPSYKWKPAKWAERALYIAVLIMWVGILVKGVFG